MLPIISAEQRIKERHSAKVCLVGAPGVGKTTQLKTLPHEKTLFIDCEAGDLSVTDWPGDSRKSGEIGSNLDCNMKSSYTFVCIFSCIQTRKNFVGV
ncbi:hypothetical protein CCP4SC76_5540009 [Gammaproteobacteria bacterium]